MQIAECKMQIAEYGKRNAEVGMQNAGLASGLALAMGKLATAGLAPAIFGPVMNVTGSSLASWWHNHLPEDDKKEKEEKTKPILI